MTLRKFLVLILALAIISSAPTASLAQTREANAAQSYSEQLATIESKVAARRKELGIPGMSLAIVKDDKVIYSKGLGFKDFEKQIAATADTQFAIGSATKAFTGLSVLMSVDEAKFSLDDSPKKVLSYFKMADTETDKNITIRDLLTHSSGLNRTDIAMITGRLNRQQLIRVAGDAKPIGKLRERFGYQNLMYAAAGEVVAVAQGQPWEKFVPERIFKPLGMANSNMSITEMEKAKDRSFGYNYNFDTKETEKLPYRNIDHVAPAGSINSSANDMAKWLRFVLAGGVYDGKRLVSEASFKEWLKPQMKVDPAGSVNYSLGWFIQKWNDLTVVQHGGNIDGFNAMVAMIPEKKLGFVMLTNVSGSPLGNELMPIVWEAFLGKPGAAETTKGDDVPPQNEAGKYRFEAAGFDIDIEWKDEKLLANVPGQPAYTLEKVSGRKYKLLGAPDGFFITFRDKELYLEQPQGNFTLPKQGSDAGLGSAPEAKELVGKWTPEKGGPAIEVKEANGNVTLNIEGQPPYTLTTREKDSFNLSPLPDTFWVAVKRGEDGKITSFTSHQPQGNVTFVRAGTVKIDISADELMAKAIDALGGAEALRRITSRLTIADVDMEQQGVKGVATSWSKAPNKFATETKLTALDIEIGSIWEYFDGEAGEQATSFTPVSKYTGKRLDDVRLSSDISAMLDWKKHFKKVEVLRKAKCGDEECYVVEFEPKAGSKFTDQYSTKTFLLKRRDGTIPSSTNAMQLPFSTRFEDYREVDGIKIAFKSINNTTGNGDVVTILRSVKHNIEIDDKLFAPRIPK
ncbi:serine hydrolase [Leptolyngbya sp. 7M]|uniref:serine hydrolase n=1 Tax=Leptolyngbya sp. 7M TaxID=2812896 RepID=UPI001B8C3EEA|nr:serine hydrolase [Leptolyngbya sp. 7M]QYO66359.1 serine hydrolase [Leptolyngbya sp. 7M]